MGSVASHLRIDLREYDRKIRTFLPHYEELLDQTATALTSLATRRPIVVDMGIGTGALSERLLEVVSPAQLIGIDADSAMLERARTRLGRRLGRRLTLIDGDFASWPLPTCDAIVGTYAFHHLRSVRAKGRFYRTCHAALAPHGVLVSGDCTVSVGPRLAVEEREAWIRHMMRHYSRREAIGHLEAWKGEDTYMTLATEMQLLRRAGFAVDVAWRRAPFSVIVATKVS